MLQTTKDKMLLYFCFVIISAKDGRSLINIIQELNQISWNTFYIISVGLASCLALCYGHLVWLSNTILISVQIITILGYLIFFCGHGQLSTLPVSTDRPT